MSLDTMSVKDARENRNSGEAPSARHRLSPDTIVGPAQRLSPVLQYAHALMWMSGRIQKLFCKAHLLCCRPF